MKNNSFKWIKLDNAGKIFPGQNTRRWSNVFRFDVITLPEDMQEHVD